MSVFWNKRSILNLIHRIATGFERRRLPGFACVQAAARVYKGGNSKRTIKCAKKYSWLPMSSFPFGLRLEDTDLILGMYPVILGAITTQRETRAHKPNLTLVAIRSTFPACLTRLTNWISIYWLTACAIWAVCDTAKIDMRYTKNMIINLLRQMGTHAGPEGRTHYSKKRLFFFVSVELKIIPALVLSSLCFIFQPTHAEPLRLESIAQKQSCSRGLDYCSRNCTKRTIASS